MNPYLVNYVPGGSIGITPQAAAQPWEAARGIGTGNLMSFFTAAGGTISNAGVTPPGLYGWRAQILAAGAVNSRAGVVVRGTGLTSISPIASVMSGAVTGYARTKSGLWYMETDVQLTTITLDANEIAFVMCPSYAYAAGTLFAGNGFGIAWANTFPNDNFHLFAVDTASVFLSADTGIVANSGAVNLIRCIWGFDGTDPIIRAEINGVTVATLTGPFVLNTANRLGAFNQACIVEVNKGQASANNAVDARFGSVIGCRIDRLL